MRPRQWTKNLLVLAPLVFAHQLVDPLAVAKALGAFAVFCALSSATYLFNDLVDLASDQRHPVKRNRPLASGRLGPTVARRAAALLAAGALGCAWLLGPGLVATVITGEERLPGATEQPTFFLTAVLYLGLQFAYTARLKHVVILDVMLIALGFVVRAVAGAAVLQVVFSEWLFACTIFLALFLALAKRRHELTSLAGEASGHRRTLAEYDPYLLDQMIVIVAASAVLSYALYTMADETVQKFKTARLNLTLPFVVYGLFRYLFLVHRRDDGGDPSRSLLDDRPLLLNVCLWGLVVVLLIYAR